MNETPVQAGFGAENPQIVEMQKAGKGSFPRPDFPEPAAMPAAPDKPKEGK